MPSVCRMPLRHAADAVAHGDAIGAARALGRTMMHREDHRLALCERHHLRARLGAWPLLDQHEFTAGEILAGRAQQDGQLQRKHQRSVEILVQAVEVVLAVAQQQRRRLCLTGRVALGEERAQCRWKSTRLAERGAPFIGDRGERRVERGAQFGDRFR